MYIVFIRERRLHLVDSANNIESVSPPQLIVFAQRKSTSPT